MDFATAHYYARGHIAVRRHGGHSVSDLLFVHEVAQYMATFGGGVWHAAAAVRGNLSRCCCSPCAFARGDKDEIARRRASSDARERAARAAGKAA